MAGRGTQDEMRAAAVGALCLVGMCSAGGCSDLLGIGHWTDLEELATDASMTGERSDAGTDTASSSGGPADGSGSSGDSGSEPVPLGDAGTPSAADAGDSASEAGPRISVPEGGAPSDPGSVVCAGAPCAVSEGYYCCSTKIDGGTFESCLPPNTGCSGVATHCNEASDCGGGLCCVAIEGIAVLGSADCVGTPTCPTNTFQSCLTNSECATGSDAGGLMRCIPQTCTNPAPARTIRVEACALPPTAMNPAGTLSYCTAD